MVRLPVRLCHTRGEAEHYAHAECPLERRLREIFTRPRPLPLAILPARQFWLDTTVEPYVQISTGPVDIE